MQEIEQKFFEGERSLFMLRNANLSEVTFGHGESPLKEGKNLNLTNVIFKWKYPLWYCDNVKVTDSIFETMSRSGIWYTNHITMKNTSLQAPKLFRRGHDIELENVHFADATETLWSCQNISLKKVQVNGDYFGKDSENIYLEDVDLIGNYCFDGGKNIEVHNARIVSKDAFWNCQNVTIYDSTINGEYLAWNAKNLTLINCIIESNQGLCYIDGLKMVNCKLLETDLCFEYCRNIDAEVKSIVKSIKKPISGKIKVKGVEELIQDDPAIDVSQVEIESED